jgi:hypothetical protein
VLSGGNVGVDALVTMFAQTGSGSRG